MEYKNSKEIKDLSKKEPLSLDNKALFKGKDLGLVNQVNDFISNKNLKNHTYLVEGIERQTRKGNFRNYNSIDLTVFPQKDVDYDSAIKDLNNLSRDSSLLNNLNVKDETKSFPTNPTYIQFTLGNSEPKEIKNKKVVPEYRVTNNSKEDSKTSIYITFLK